MNNFKKKLLTTVTVMALSPLAQAGLVTFSDNHTSSIADWTDTLTVSQFDASLGALDTVTITFSTSMLTDMILDNDNVTATSSQGTVDVGVGGSFLGLGGLGVALSATTGLQYLAADDSGDTDSPLDGGADEYAGLGLFDSGSLTITIDSASADFLNFIGTGDLSTVGLGTLGGYTVLGGGGNIDVNVNTFAAANLTVDYSYTAVSEPASLAILGLGLMGIALRRKKKSL